MSTSDSDGNCYPAGTNSQRVPGDYQRRAQCERLLRDALLATDDAALLNAEVAALRHVVARHRGDDLTFDPITVELVAALLSAAFRVRIENSPMCMEMTRMIAKSLWSDPVIRERVHSLWGRLSEQSG